MKFSLLLSLRLAIAILASLSCTALLPADTTKVTVRTVTQIAEGIYTIRHADAPDGFPQGNTTVVIGNDAVLVVDSCYLPSSAREDIAQIKQWTSKPVRYLVNTHWHPDHQLGNGAYAEAFSGIQIIAQVETRNQIRGYNPGWLERFPAFADRYRKALADGFIQAGGPPLTDEQRGSIQAILEHRSSVVEEFKTNPGTAPTVTFDQEMNLDLGHRQVQLRHLGRGHTAGDAVVLIPGDHVLVAGDLVSHPVPFVGTGFPYEMVATLGKLLELDISIIVPGHGQVLRGDAGRAHTALIRDFLSEVTTQVSAAVHKIGNASGDLKKMRAEVELHVDFKAWRQKFAGDNKEDQDFFDSFPLPGLMQTAYAETWPR